MNTGTDRTIQNIFACYQSKITQVRRPLKHLKAIDAIVSCQTASRGSSVYECENEGTFHTIHHSCRHRSCSVCSNRQKHEWVEKQQSRLLDCAHFHCVFTLPHEYHVLWQYNQKWFVSTFFNVVKSTLLDLMKDEKYQGVEPGVLMAMHTWGRQLTLHPHIHCVVTAGGLEANGQWKDSRDFLLPSRVVRALYRGRFQSAIRKAIDEKNLRLPPDLSRKECYQLWRRGYQKTWCVRIEEKYAHGRGILLYLSRYMRGGPVNPKQLVQVNNEQIGMRFKDHRDKRIKLLKIKPLEFIRRILLHVPEPGQHMVRHYGLYGGAAKVKRNRCREQIGGLMEELCTDEPTDNVQEKVLLCRHCGHALKLRKTSYPRREKGNSYKVTFNPAYVQPDGEPVATLAKKRSAVMML